MKQKSNIPRAVVSRLTKYLCYLQRLCEAQIGYISSSELAERLGLTSSTVRQDLSYISRFFGVSRRGYDTRVLCQELEDLLGINSTWNFVVVGAGNIGRAISLHEDFYRRGFIISGIFDSDNAKIGMKVGNLVVKSMSDLSSVVKKQKADIGIIAVPVQAAQVAADALVAAGIKGILNFSTAHIIVPNHIPVVDARIAESFMELAYLIKFRKK